MRQLLRSTWLLSAVAGSAIGCGPAWAQDYLSQSFPDDYQPQMVSSVPDDTVRLRASIGAMQLESNEYVFSGGYTVSRLIWKTTAPVLRGSIDIDLGAGFSVSAEGSVAALGMSRMEDYDWLGGDDTFDNWTHRSQHNDTRLDHFWTGAATVGYSLGAFDDATIRLHAGFKYTDVQWSAYGGTYTYSVNGFRDTSGSFPDGEPGITYRQQFPELFLGVDGDQYYYDGAIRVGGMLRGGATLMAVATDHHWMRDLRFVDSFKVAPTVSAGLDVGFKLTDFAELVIAARYDQMLMQRGDTKTYDIPSGAQVGSYPDGAGTEMYTLELSGGVRGTF